MPSLFYTSGFLYNLKTRQILLLKSPQSDNEGFLWSTFGGESGEGEDIQTAFLRITNKLLNSNLKQKDIYPIYDYFHEVKDKTNYVFYAEVKSAKKFDSLNKVNFSWVTFGEVSKLSFTPRTRQDVIVGERVINAKQRTDETCKINLSDGQYKRE